MLKQIRELDDVNKNKVDMRVQKKMHQLVNMIKCFDAKDPAKYLMYAWQRMF